MDNKDYFVYGMYVERSKMERRKIEHKIESNAEMGREK